MIIFLQLSKAQVRRVTLNGVNDNNITSTPFANILKKNMGLRNGLTQITTVSFVQLSSTIGKPITLTTEHGNLIAYLLNTIATVFNNPGFSSDGDDKVYKFDGGLVSDSLSGTNWTQTGTGDVNPTSPRVWPFLLYQRKDIS